MATVDNQVFEILSDDAKSLWRENQARSYWWQGRHGEAAEIVRAESEKLPFDVDLRWLLFSILIDNDKNRRGRRGQELFACRVAETFPFTRSFGVSRRRCGHPNAG